MEQFNQPKPVGNDEVVSHREVIKDIQARLELGIREYGTGLQPFNGRNAPLDVYEEELDKLCYLKTWIIERDRMITAFKDIAGAVDIATAKLKAFEMLVKTGEWDERGRSEGNPEGLAD